MRAKHQEVKVIVKNKKKPKKSLFDRVNDFIILTTSFPSLGTPDGQLINALSSKIKFMDDQIKILCEAIENDCVVLVGFLENIEFLTSKDQK
jgi:hypothetical protein